MGRAASSPAQRGRIEEGVFLSRYNIFSMSNPPRPTVFLSYSHRDDRWLGELRTMLAPLEHDGLVEVWWDGDIEPSERWREEIDNALASARIGVLLVSPN